LQRDFENAFRDTASALRELGVEIPEVVSLKQADAMFDQVEAEILALGFDHICALPKTRNPRTDLIVSLMNYAAMNAWWGARPGFPEWIGVTVSPTRIRMRSPSLTPDERPLTSHYDMLDQRPGLSPELIQSTVKVYHLVLVSASYGVLEV